MGTEFTTLFFILFFFFFLWQDSKKHVKTARQHCQFLECINFYSRDVLNRFFCCCFFFSSDFTSSKLSFQRAITLAYIFQDRCRNHNRLKENMWMEHSVSLMVNELKKFFRKCYFLEYVTLECDIKALTKSFLYSGIWELFLKWPKINFPNINSVITVYYSFDFFYRICWRYSSTWYSLWCNILRTYKLFDGSYT